MFESVSRWVRVALTLTAIGVMSADTQARTWIDVTGKFSVEAELVEVKDGKAILRRTDGKTTAVPIEKLSKADQEFVQQPAKPKDVKLNLTLPDAMTEPPEWLASDPSVPFDTKEFFEVPPPEENAAPLYIKAMAETDLRLALHLRGLDAKSDAGKAFLDGRVKRKREISDFHLKFWDFQEDPTEFPEPPASEAQPIREKFPRLVKLLLEAQTRPQCVFQVGRTWHADRIGLPMTMDIPVYYALKEGNVEPALQYFQIELRFGRDLQPRGNLSKQIGACRHASNACVLPETTEPDNSLWIAEVVLASPSLTVADCDRWIQLLQQHLDANRDYFVDQCCADYIVRRGILHDLQSGEYRQVMKDQDMAIPPLGPNPFIYLANVKHLLFTDGLERQHPILARAKDSRSPEGTAALQEYYAKLTSLRDSDYQREIDALNQCYKSLIALGELPTQERNKQIPQAVEPLLKTDVAIWLAPTTMRHLLERPMQSETKVKATLCLVALRRWQLDKGAPATDLKAALKAAGVDEVPIDPFSDEPLRTATMDGKLVVYSVGPDGKDDGGLILYDYQKNLGDFVFRIGR